MLLTLNKSLKICTFNCLVLKKTKICIYSIYLLLKSSSRTDTETQVSVKQAKLSSKYPWMKGNQISITKKDHSFLKCLIIFLLTNVLV